MEPTTISEPVVSSEVTRELVTIAARFLATLIERQRERALMDFDVPERHDWHYVPRQRPGVALREMDEAQRCAALALLHVGPGTKRAPCTRENEHMEIVVLIKLAVRLELFIAHGVVVGV